MVTPAITLLCVPSSPANVGATVTLHAVVTDVPDADLAADEVVFTRTVGDALFVDGTKRLDTFEAGIHKSGAVWQADATLTSGASGTSTIYVELKLLSGALLGAQQTYTFKGAPPKMTVPTVEPNYADNVSPFTISGEVLDEFNKPIVDLDMELRIGLGSMVSRWAIPEHDRPNTTACRTDATTGKYSAQLYTTTESALRVIASVLDNPDADDQTISFKAIPEPLIILELTQDGAAADGHQRIKAVAKAVRKSKPTEVLPNVALDFTLDGDAVFDPKSLHPKTTSGTTGTDGTASVSFASTKIGTGFIKCEVHSHPVANISQAYSFDQAWCSATNVYFEFTGTGDAPATIYANGRNQAEVSLSFTLTDSNGDILTPDNSPTLAEVLKHVELEAYENQQPLGSGANLPWASSDQENEYSKQFTDGLPGRRAATPPTMPARPADAIPPKGRVSLTYYVTCQSTEQQHLNLGFRISPSGGTGPNTPIVADPANGDYHSPLKLKAIVPPNYRADDFKIDAKNMSGPSDGAALDGNTAASAYWRRWDYVVSIDSDRPGSPVLHKRVDPAEYQGTRPCIRSRWKDLYGWELYFWPQIDAPAAGQQIKSFTTEVPCARPVVLTPQVGLLSFTIFTAFSGVIQDGEMWVYRDLQLGLIDSYGNEGLAYVNRNLPDAYVSDANADSAMAKWRPLSALPSSVPAIESPPQRQSTRGPTDENGYFLGTVNLALRAAGADGMLVYVPILGAEGAPAGTQVRINTPRGKQNDLRLYSNEDPRTFYADDRSYKILNLDIPAFFGSKDGQLQYGTQTDAAFYKPYEICYFSKDATGLYGLFCLQPLWNKWPSVVIWSLYDSRYMRATPAADAILSAAGLSNSDTFVWTPATVTLGGPM